MIRECDLPAMYACNSQELSLESPYYHLGHFYDGQVGDPAQKLALSHFILSHPISLIKLQNNLQLSYLQLLQYSSASRGEIHLPDNAQDAHTMVGSGRHQRRQKVRWVAIWDVSSVMMLI